MKNSLTSKVSKTVLALAAVCILMLALSATTWADDWITRDIKKFTDVPESHWAYMHITRLTYEGAITGYPDGTFGPSRNITRAEFLAVVVGAILTRPEAPPAGQHWATNIIKSAETNSLLESGEFAQATWGQPINRQEMAKIMARAMQYVRKEALAENTSAYTVSITDFAKTPENYRNYVAQVYAKGIVNGYPDGTFGGSRQATRAEAATMVVRLIDPSHRLTITAVDNPVSTGITFNPAVDLAADGRMKMAKAEEYMMKTIQSLKFYFEDGKFYFEGNVAEVPEGFRNRLNITIVFKDGVDAPNAVYSSFPLSAQTPLPTSGPFKVEVTGISRVDQISYSSIGITINARKHTNTVYDAESFEVIWIIESVYDNRIEVTRYIGVGEYGIRTQKFYDLSTIFIYLNK